MNKQVAAADTSKERAVAMSVDEEFARDADPASLAALRDKGAVAIPFLGLLQGLSPQVQRGTPQYINGAAPGMLFNSVTKEVADSVEVTVLQVTHTFCWWTLREEGGGFKGEEPWTEDLAAQFRELWNKRDDKNRAINADGLEMTEHWNFWCAQDRGADKKPMLFVISMSKSQLTIGRNWNTSLLMTVAGNNASSEIWSINSMLRTKKDNQWYVWNVRHKARHGKETMTFYRAAIESRVVAQQQVTLPRQLEHDPGIAEM